MTCPAPAWNTIDAALKHGVPTLLTSSSSRRSALQTFALAASVAAAGFGASSKYCLETVTTSRVCVLMYSAMPPVISCNMVKEGVSRTKRNVVS
jgi:hypothetical protein